MYETIVPLSALFGLLFAGTAGIESQQKSASKPAGGGGMRTPQPRPEHKELQKLVGEWDATVTTAKPGEAPQTSPARCTYMPIGEMWVASEFKGEMGGAPYTGHGVEGFDTHKSRFISLWIDSWSTEFMSFEGARDPSTKLLTMTGGGRDVQTGKPIELRTTAEMKGNDAMVFRMYMPGPDGKEVETMKIEYKRRK